MTDQKNNIQGNCIRCGLCLAVCPTYREYLTETVSPRGRVTLVNQGLSGELEFSENLTEQMYGCFGCMACDEICPAGVRPSDLVLEMRQTHEQLHPAAWKKPFFQDIIPKPDRIELATLPLRIYERSGIRRWVYSLGNMHLIPRRVLDMEAMLPHLPRRPLRQVLPKVTQAIGVSRFRVGFFLGCAQSLLFARESAATVRVLARNGCTVITPKEISCCGMPATGFGRQDMACSQARHNIAVFEEAGVETIITDCATCGSMLKSYAQLLADDAEWSERATSFSNKVRDVSEYLMNIPLAKPQHRMDMRVTYHDPCHLRRGQGIWKEPRSLLQMIDGVDLVELPEADWCCGSAGSQLITHYQLSRKVMQRKIDNLESTQAQVIASGCPGCQMQLNAGLRQRGLDVQVVHPVELLDWSYSGKR
jgi:glycolate dehydrogenase iron-sulfur subunit